MQSLIENVQSLYDDFTPQQKMIADLILSRTFLPEFRTARALSDRLSISSSTVVRFAHRLGYSGFPDLSRELHQLFYEENTPMLKIRKSLFNSESPENPIAQVRLYEEENLQQMEYLNPPEKFAPLIELLKGAEKYSLLGQGLPTQSPFMQVSFSASWKSGSLS